MGLASHCVIHFRFIKSAPINIRSPLFLVTLSTTGNQLMILQVLLCAVQEAAGPWCVQLLPAGDVHQPALQCHQEGSSRQQGQGLRQEALTGQLNF